MAEDKHILVTLNGTPAGLCGATKAAMFMSFYSNSLESFSFPICSQGILLCSGNMNGY